MHRWLLFWLIVGLLAVKLNIFGIDAFLASYGKTIVSLQVLCFGLAFVLCLNNCVREIEQGWTTKKQ